MACKVDQHDKATKADNIAYTFISDSISILGDTVYYPNRTIWVIKPNEVVIKGRNFPDFRWSTQNDSVWIGDNTRRCVIVRFRNQQIQSIETILLEGKDKWVRYW